MNLLRILNAALASALFTFSPTASAAPRPSAGLVSPDSATASDKEQRKRSSSAAAAAGVRRNTEGRARAEGPSNAGGGKAEQGIGQAPRANSDRLRSLLKRQAPTPRTAVAASHRGAASTAVPSRHAAAPPHAAVAPPQNSVARIGTLGGARAQEHARLGGPSLGKPPHAAALDGTQLQRRKY
jgi:hypothetical protein